MARKRFTFFRAFQVLFLKPARGMKRRSWRLSLFLFWAVLLSFFAVNVQAECSSNLANIGEKKYIVGVDKVEKVAVSSGNSAISNQPQDGKEWEVLARQRYAAGEFAEAAKYWQQAVSAFEVKGDWLNQAIALSNLSLTYQQFGRWEEANSAIAKSLSLLPLESKATSPAELKAIRPNSGYPRKWTMGTGPSQSCIKNSAASDQYLC
jgi:tetratricopeptide (TPR) repeat protein